MNEEAFGLLLWDWIDSTNPELFDESERIRVKTNFEQAGNKGLILSVGDSEFQVTIVREK